jgi:regulator of extracellular matrix RemA (YlzA/DUF370 family)
MQRSWPVGVINPYNIIMVTNIKGAILTSDYFVAESTLIETILATQAPMFIDAKSITALSYFNGQYVTFDDAMGYFNPYSADYSSSTAGSYRLKIGSKMNQDMSASQITIETIINPDSTAIARFVQSVRNKLESFSRTTTLNNNFIEAWLIGGYCTSLDVQKALYELLPTMIVCTLAVAIVLVGISFGSLMIAARLVSLESPSFAFL